MISKEQFVKLRKGDVLKATYTNLPPFHNFGNWINHGLYLVESIDLSRLIISLCHNFYNEKSVFLIQSADGEFTNWTIRHKSKDSDLVEISAEIESIRIASKEVETRDDVKACLIENNQQIKMQQNKMTPEQRVHTAGEDDKRLLSKS